MNISLGTLGDKLEGAALIQRLRLVMRDIELSFSKLNLDRISGLAVTDGNFIVGNGVTWVVESGATVRASLGLTIGSAVQAWDADLDALAALASTGIAVRTAANTWAQRTITGTANQITVGDGNGVAGNPTLSLPSAVTLPGSLTVTTDLSVNGNTTIGNASGDALTFHPSGWTLSNAVTITGTWTNLGTVTTVTINGGTIAGITDLAVADGGTGSSTPAAARVALGVDERAPNLLINPNWQIDQINEGALYTADASERGPDGWTAALVGAGVFKMRTLADPDNAALKCLEITCTTADASIAATDNYYIYTAIEGYDAAALMAGTASAQAITVQFKLKSNSVTGVFGVAIQNSAGNRRYIGTITVPDTAENEYSVSLTMDTSGTWLYTNGIGLKLILTLAAGANFQGTAGAWGAGAEQTTSSQANFMSANTNIIYLKRIQLIPGSLVQAYRPADIQKELAKCQRYFNKTFPSGTAPAQAAGIATGALGSDFAYANAAGVAGIWEFPVRMRAAPTVVSYNPTQANANWRNAANTADTNRTISEANEWGVRIQGDTSTVAGHAYLIHLTAESGL